VTELFEASVALAGRMLERAAARDGSRGIGVAARTDRNVRELVTVVGPGVPAPALAAREGWDLPLVAAEVIETPSGPRTFVAELLPVGVPSTWLDAATTSAPGTLPPFALDLARRVAAEHALGGVVGPMHPATVLVDPVARTLVAVAQRPLRIAGVIGVEGDRPLLGYRMWAPDDVTGEGPSTAGDVFRLALALWQWRRGAHPFGNLPDGELLAVLGDLAAGAAAPLPTPSDDLDAVLLGCLAPSATARPSAADVVAGLEASA
jgi:hypothetical protein